MRLIVDTELRLLSAWIAEKLAKLTTTTVASSARMVTAVILNRIECIHDLRIRYRRE